MKRIIWIGALSVLLYSTGLAQPELYPLHRLKVAAEVPVQFSLDYELSFTRRLSTQLQLGLLSEPNTNLILSTLEALGTDELVILMIEDAFQSGWVMEGGVHYNFGRNYTGLFIQQLRLNGKDTPQDLVETVMDTEISDEPGRSRRGNASEATLTLKSNLWQAGLLYGRRFPFKDGHSEINLEVGFSKNIGSSSSLYAEGRNLNALSKSVDIYLDNIYHDYAYIPSFTVAFVRVL
ncbi:MAG: hypothetical protein RIG62_13405 [Cyclobacteriaceae bacterium]